MEVKIEALQKLGKHHRNLTSYELRLRLRMVTEIRFQPGENRARDAK